MEKIREIEKGAAHIGYMKKIHGKDMWKRRGVAHIGYMEDADSWASSNHVTPRSFQLLLSIISHLAPTSKMQIPKLGFDHVRKNPLNEFGIQSLYVSKL